MDIISSILDSSNWEEFISYRLRSRHLTKAEAQSWREFIDAKVLGFIVNFVETKSGGKYNYGKYSRYRYGYGGYGGYGYGGYGYGGYGYGGYGGYGYGYGGYGYGSRSYGGNKDSEVEPPRR